MPKVILLPSRGSPQLMEVISMAPHLADKETICIDDNLRICYHPKSDSDLLLPFNQNVEYITGRRVRFEAILFRSTKLGQIVDVTEQDIEKYGTN